MSDAEHPAMLLRSGTRGHDVLTLAARLIVEAGSLAGLIAWQTADFRKLKCIGRVKALQLVTVMEVARRVIGQQAGDAPMLGRAELVVAFFQPTVAGLEAEKWRVLCLNRKNRLLKRVEITSGTPSAALAHPRDVFRAAIHEAASAVICVHNHPSGDPAPSAADLQVTRLLRDAAKTVDIALFDHVSVAPTQTRSGRGYYSFRAAGLM